MKAFMELEEMLVPVFPELDYDQELAEARDENKEKPFGVWQAENVKKRWILEERVAEQIVYFSIISIIRYKEAAKQQRSIVYRVDDFHKFRYILWRRSKTLMQASLHRIFGLLTLVLY